MTQVLGSSGNWSPLHCAWLNRTVETVVRVEIRQPRGFPHGLGTPAASHKFPQPYQSNLSPLLPSSRIQKHKIYVTPALAVARSPWGAPSGEAVIAAAGTSGLQAAAVASWPGPVTVWAQDDKPSVLRAVRLGAALHTAGRAVTIQRPADGLHGMDWADVAQLEHDERKGIQHE